MINFEISVNNLQDGKVKGIKIPGTIDEFVHSVEDGATFIEVPISGINNGYVKLKVVGKSEKPKLVLEDNSELDLLEDGSLNVVNKEETKEDKEKKEDKVVTPPVANETHRGVADHLGDTTHTGVATSSETVSPGATSPVTEENTGLVTGTEAGSL